MRVGYEIQEVLSENERQLTFVKCDLKQSRHYFRCSNRHLPVDYSHPLAERPLLIGLR